MDKKRINRLGIGLFIVWLLFISVFRANLGSDARLFNDDYDRGAYSIRGEWLLRGEVPYRDVPSEYPQVPTYLFGVPYLFASPQSVEAFGYSAAQLHFFVDDAEGSAMGPSFLLYRMLPAHKDRAFLLLLPASLYFAYNRFRHILPSFLVLLSLFFLQRKRDVLTGIVLGIAVLTKWYPVLLFPIYCIYAYHARHRIAWKMTLAFGVTCFLLILPTLLTAGLPGVLQPYAFHGGREIEYAALPALFHSIFSGWFGIPINVLSLLTTVFLGLSVLPALLSVFSRIDTIDKVVYWSILVITSFIFFSRIWSPQWMLWLLPLLILTARAPRHIYCIILYGILNYMAFPLTYDLAGQASWLLRVIVIISYLLLVYEAVVAYLGSREIIPSASSIVLES